MISTQRWINTTTALSSVLLALCALSLTACDRASGELRIYPPPYQQLDPEAMQAIFQDHTKVALTAATPMPGTSGLDALVADEADLALVENSASFVPGVRAILPAYQSVLHLLARSNYQAEVPNQALKGASIYIAGHSSAGQAFVEVITKRQGLELGDYTLSPTLEPGKTDVIIYFGPINSNNVSWHHPGYELVSLDSRFNPQREFFQEGIGYLVPNMKPKVIPPLTYTLPGNEKPVLTVAVDALLVARKDVPEALVYQLTETLIEQKARFTAISPQLFARITESFDPLDLNFPLHNGARRYYERDEPGLLERYAESINLLVYMAFLVLTGFVALSRWRGHRKKDRIDTFYIRVLSVQERAVGEPHPALLKELFALEQEAFAALIDEKLAADESFRIFTDLLARVRAELASGRHPPRQ